MGTSGRRALIMGRLLSMLWIVVTVLLVGMALAQTQTAEPTPLPSAAPTSSVGKRPHHKRHHATPRMTPGP